MHREVLGSIGKNRQISYQSVRGPLYEIKHFEPLSVKGCFDGMI